MKRDRKERGEIMEEEGRREKMTKVKGKVKGQKEDNGKWFASHASKPPVPELTNI